MQDLSNNKITDISYVNTLSQLVVLKVDHNQLTSAQLAPVCVLVWHASCDTVNVVSLFTSNELSSQQDHWY